MPPCTKATSMPATSPESREVLHRSEGLSSRCTPSRARIRGNAARSAGAAPSAGPGAHGERVRRAGCGSGERERECRQLQQQCRQRVGRRHARRPGGTRATGGVPSRSARVMAEFNHESPRRQGSHLRTGYTVGHLLRGHRQLMATSGVSWRLARQLVAEHGLIAPVGRRAGKYKTPVPGHRRGARCRVAHGVEVRRWDEGASSAQPADVVIEAFGCELPAEYALDGRDTRPKVRAGVVNLEYLERREVVTGCRPALPRSLTRA